MKDYINFDKIKEIGDKTNTSIFERVIKLQEECGEVSSSFLGYSNSLNKSQSSKEGTERERRLDLLEEVLDTMIVSVDLVNTLTEGISKDEVEEIVERKLLKWNSKISTSSYKERMKIYEEFAN